MPDPMVQYQLSQLSWPNLSANADVLFVNVFGDGTPGSGLTCAITGPRLRGAL